MPLKKCPVCGVSVKLENLEKHVKNQHPKDDVDLRETLSSEEIRTTQKARVTSKPRNTGRLAWLVALIAIIVVIIVTVSLMNPPPTSGVSVGEVAPDFNLTTTTGGTMTLSAYRGKPVLLEFMDVDCGFCKTEARDILSVLHGTYNPAVQFLSVDVNFVGAADDNSRIETFKTTYGTNWAYALDVNGIVTDSYKIDSTPRTFIIDKEGIVRNIFYGHTDMGIYENALNAVLD